MKFVKMHGIKNDYVYVDAVSEPAIASRPDLADLTRRISDRHTGVGSDGLILVCRPEVPGAHVRMRMFNADGSESEMCGNGVRCVAKFAHDRLGVHARPMLVQTGRGVLSIDYVTEAGKLIAATVDMGEPILELERVPVDASKVAPTSREHEHAFEAGGRAYQGSFVSMGNPHVVIFTESVGEIDLERVGPAIERHAAFPRRINVHFVQVSEASGRPAREATMRTWERGAGITLACGTGAAAVAVAGVRTGRLDRDVLLHLPGGDLRLRWDEQSGHVFKTGPATDVFEGEWPEG